jgi:predicted nucleic acid-binding protein
MREPHYETSYEIFRICYHKKATGYISNLTFANIVYIMRKQLDSTKIIDVLESLSELFTFKDLQFADLKEAASLKWKDFEDAIQYVTAERINANYIITRNTKDFQNAKIPALTPNEFLEKIHM